MYAEPESQYGSLGQASSFPGAPAIAVSPLMETDHPKLSPAAASEAVSF